MTATPTALLFATLAALLGLFAPPRAQDGYPTLSPFTGVHFEGETPRVEVEGEWYRLVSLDGIAAQALVAHCKEVHRSRWDKRFAEDLVQVLAEMGHEHDRAVDLVLLRLDDGERVELRDVRMTEANRRAVWEGRRNGRGPGGAPAVERVERRHAQRAAKAWAHLAAPLECAEWRDAPRIPRELAEQDLDQLEHLVRQRFSYRDRAGVDVEAAFDAARLSFAGDPTIQAFALQLVRLLSAFGDGHSRFDYSRTAFYPSGCLPFLMDVCGERVVAFDGDRTRLLDAERPYVTKLDGRPVDEWIAAAAQVVPGDSPQFRRAQALRCLRWPNLARLLMGDETSGELQVELADERGRDRATRTVALVRDRDVYGEWPRTHTRELDGGIGYLRVARMESDDAFLDGLRTAMGAFRDTQGLVIDVRGNGGGSRLALKTLLPYFMAPDEPPTVVNVAAYRLREGDRADDPRGFLDDRFLFPAAWPGWSDEQRAAVERFAKRFRPAWKLPKGEFSEPHYMLVSAADEPRAFHYDRPLVVLVDAGCFSATDVFLGAFAEREGVTLMGAASGGGSGRARPARLANSGLELRLSSMASFRPTGALYEGRGVEVDVPVAPVPTDFLGETDTVLQAALARLAEGGGQ